MMINVKLFGTLSRPVSGYHPDRGLSVEVPEGSSVADLLALLEISGSSGIAVIMEGQVLPVEARLTDGDRIQVFQIMSGG
jgi:thiamine biosynthesis protein ThiS